MRKVRGNNHIVFNDVHIMLFQDLSQITLKNRRVLCPLLEQLRWKDIKYTWRFPFALDVTLAGKQHIPLLPANLPGFCEALNLDLIDLTE